MAVISASSSSMAGAWLTGRSAGWGKGLAQSLGDLGWGGVIINHQASGVSMPNHAREIQHIQFPGQPGQGFMAGIVECQVIDACYLDRLAEIDHPALLAHSKHLAGGLRLQCLQ